VVQHGVVAAVVIKLIVVKSVPVEVIVAAAVSSSIGCDSKRCSIKSI